MGFVGSLMIPLYVLNIYFKNTIIAIGRFTLILADGSFFKNISLLPHLQIDWYRGVYEINELERTISLYFLP